MERNVQKYKIHKWIMARSTFRYRFGGLPFSFIVLYHAGFNDGRLPMRRLQWVSAFLSVSAFLTGKLVFV